MGEISIGLEKYGRRLAGIYYEEDSFGRIARAVYILLNNGWRVALENQPRLWYYNDCLFWADIAQLVEQRTCNAQVIGSIPIVGSIEIEVFTFLIYHV